MIFSQYSLFIQYSILFSGLVFQEIGLGHIFNTTIEIMFSLFGKTCVEGAQTTLYCSLDKSAEAGEYFMDCTRHALQGGLEKEKTEGSKPEKLWETSLQMLGMKSTL